MRSGTQTPGTCTFAGQWRRSSCVAFGAQARAVGVFQSHSTPATSTGTHPCANCCPCGSVETTRCQLGASASGCHGGWTGPRLTLTLINFSLLQGLVQVCDHGPATDGEGWQQRTMLVL